MVRIFSDMEVKKIRLNDLGETLAFNEDLSNEEVKLIDDGEKRMMVFKT